MTKIHIHPKNVHDFVAARPRVFLDGEEIDGGLVTEANEGDGYIVMNIPAKDGMIVVDPRTDEIRQVKLFGRVDITFEGLDLLPQQISEIAQLFVCKTLKAK